MSRYVANFDLDKLGAWPEMEIVDVGCGDGAFARELARAGFSVTGIEPEAYLRRQFEQEAGGVDSGSLRVLDGTAEDLPFRDGEIRRVIITEVLEHVADPAVAMAEISRVMAPGGMLCASVPTSYTERIYKTLHPSYMKNATHVRIFRKRTLIGLLERSGFRVISAEGANYQPAVSWIFHAALRSDSDHTGRIEDHLRVDRWLDRLWGALARLRLLRAVSAVGNRVFPKSWYVYAEKS